MQTTFFSLGRFLKKLADGQSSSITKGSYLPYQPYVHITFYHSSGLTRNWMLMEVSTMLHICRYCVFTWYGRKKVIPHPSLNKPFPWWKCVCPLKDPPYNQEKISGPSHDAFAPNGIFCTGSHVGR